MMFDETLLVELSTFVQTLATDKGPSNSPRDNTAPLLRLSGPDSPAKRTLENELVRLTHRIHHLETKIDAAAMFPDITTDSESADAVRCVPSGAKVKLLGQQSVSQSPLVDESGELLEGLHVIVDGQSELIPTQKQDLDSGVVGSELVRQKHAQSESPEEQIEKLSRELFKHQRANEAFQKALREIGEIVTAVARGDLSKKVHTNSVEMDPEITTFKRTINTMMDQLQVFASEVSRVAREVGTEGLLGGQARIDGVDGTWKELTDNGELFFSGPGVIYFPIKSSLLTWFHSQRHGPKSYGSR